ncbi:hypothetical protein G6F37_010575 [Rhizopus arrhizus]|nr:hypothetical protein G6F38_010627 [Rhizopus arrhizus]KAG1153196.1 hypothetical protein G6F37_010575 [Rhizopus arrhizus]
MDANQNLPDGCAENDHKVIGYFEVKPIKYAKNHKKMNIDLHRLCTFSKASTAKYKSKHKFQVMAVGLLHVSDKKCEQHKSSKKVRPRLKDFFLQLQILKL